MVYVVYNLSINRNPDEEYDFFSSIYFYFCGCIPHTSIRLETIDFEYTFGFTFLSGMLRPFMLVYKYLFGGGSFPHLYQVSIDIPSTLQSPTVYVADGHAFNAFVLPFYYFYNDGGFIAVALESLLYGFFCTYTYERYKRTGKEKDFAKYLIVVNYIATSMIRYDFAIVYFALCYFYVNVFYSYEDCEDSKVPDS